MIVIRNLSFGYSRELLFKDMSLVLEPGNIYGLLGLNGAGKSTLLRLATGLLFPHRGSIEAFGHEPARRNPSFLANVFMLPEELNLPGITGTQYVAALAPFYDKFDRARFDRCVEEFELPPDKKLTSLSYGQKKKFLLSFGLASGTALLVLDEPTNGLDIPSKGLFRRLVAEASTDERIFVISTHQVRDVESLIDPIVILHEGRVLFNHTMTDVTAKIRMSHSVSKPPQDAPGLLHCEPAVGGYWSVWSEGDADGLIDLEVLFNTVVSRPDLYASVFDGKGAAA